MRKADIIAMVGAGAVVIGAFMPWIERPVAVGRILTLNGFSGRLDGVGAAAVVLGALALLLVAVRQGSLLVGFAGIGCVLAAGWGALQVFSMASEDDLITVSGGFYMFASGAALLALSGFFTLRVKG